MKKYAWSAAMSAAALHACATVASADGTMVTKAPPAAAATTPATCTGLWDFVTTKCPLTWYGITVYGTIDIGGGYQTHGAPFDPNFVTGASYFMQKMNREPMWGLAPNGLSQSSIGIRGVEPIAPGWSFIFDWNAGFDPYSLRFANSPGSEVANIGLPVAAQTTNGDSSRAGQWYNNVGYVGVASPTYGALAVFRQMNFSNEIGVLQYDPMGGSYAFSPIGFSGVVGGGGDTQNARYSTSVKYFVTAGMFHAGALAQFGGYDLNNGSNGAYEGDVGFKWEHLGPGTLSMDAIAGWNKDAVSIALTQPGATILASGVPTAYPQYLSATISNNTNVMLLAKYAVGPAMLYAGFQWMQFAPPSDLQTQFTDISGFTVTGSAAGLLSTASTNGITAINNVAYTTGCAAGVNCGDKILDAYWAGVKYAVTKDVTVIGAYYHYWQNQFTVTAPVGYCNTATAHSQCSGTMDAASAVIDWQFAPKWDTYIGTFYSRFDGGLANGYLTRDNLATTAGLRFRF
jgi:predicted porin